MSNIKDEALAYVPKQMKNIVDLEVVRTDADMKTETFNKDKEDEYTASFVEINNEKYRVPASVLKSLKKSKDLRISHLI